MQPKYWNKAKKYLSAKDKTLAEIFSLYKGETLQSNGNAFKTFAKAIVGQQISVKAADAIWARFNKLFGRKKISYQNFLNLSHEELRGCGFSKQKIQYLSNIAYYFKDNKATEKYFTTKDPDELAEELLAIKGVGKWTLQMFQIFYLLEPDIFPETDLGLIKAIEKHYPLRHCEPPTGDYKNEAIQKLSKKWKPYRTVVTWYLWRTFDEEPVAY